MLKGEYSGKAFETILGIRKPSEVPIEVPISRFKNSLVSQINYHNRKDEIHREFAELSEQLTAKADGNPVDFLEFYKIARNLQELQKFLGIQGRLPNSKDFSGNDHDVVFMHVTLGDPSKLGVPSDKETWLIELWIIATKQMLRDEGRIFQNDEETANEDSVHFGCNFFQCLIFLNNHYYGGKGIPPGTPIFFGGITRANKQYSLYESCTTKQQDKGAMIPGLLSAVRIRYPLVKPDIWFEMEYGNPQMKVIYSSPEMRPTIGNTSSIDNPVESKSIVSTSPNNTNLRREAAFLNQTEVWGKKPSLTLNRAERRHNQIPNYKVAKINESDATSEESDNDELEKKNNDSITTSADSDDEEEELSHYNAVCNNNDHSTKGGKPNTSSDKKNYISTDELNFATDVTIGSGQSYATGFGNELYWIRLLIHRDDYHNKDRKLNFVDK